MLLDLVPLNVEIEQSQTQILGKSPTSELRDLGPGAVVDETT